MEKLFRFPAAVHHDAGVAAWMDAHAGELGDIARKWFDVMRGCGADVRELLHDGHPTACAGDAAFGYVNAFTSHVNVGFFKGAELPTPPACCKAPARPCATSSSSPASPSTQRPWPH